MHCACKLWQRQRHVKHLLKQCAMHVQANKHASATALARSAKRQRSRTHITIRVVSCTLRAAFSQIPFLQSLMWMVNSIVLVPTVGNCAADVKTPPVLSAVEQARICPAHGRCSHTVARIGNCHASVATIESRSFKGG